MKSKKHSPQQVIRKLGEAEAALASGKELAVVCQMLGVSTKTFYRWRKKYGGMKADEAKRLVALEEENKQLKTDDPIEPIPEPGPIPETE